MQQAHPPHVRTRSRIFVIVTMIQYNSTLRTARGQGSQDNQEETERTDRREAITKRNHKHQKPREKEPYCSCCSWLHFRMFAYIMRQVKFSMRA